MNPEYVACMTVLLGVCAVVGFSLLQRIGLHRIDEVAKDLDEYTGIDSVAVLELVRHLRRARTVLLRECGNDLELFDRAWKRVCVQVEHEYPLPVRTEAETQLSLMVPEEFAGAFSSK